MVALPGTTLYTGQVSSYVVLSPSSVEFTCILDETVGTFTYGAIGLYLDNGTLFAVSCLDTPRLKKSNSADGEGDAIAIIARLNYTNLTTAFSFNQQTLVEAKMLEMAGVHLLQPPAISPSNAYITHTVSARGGQVVAFRATDWLWDLSGWVPVAGATSSEGSFTGGVITDATTLSLTFEGIGSSFIDFEVGDYLIQFVSGPFKGYCRKVVSYTTNSITWEGTFPSAPAAGSQFVLYRNAAVIANNPPPPDLSNYWNKQQSDERYLVEAPASVIGGQATFVTPGTHSFAYLI
jgi:hypothetical protein